METEEKNSVTTFTNSWFKDATDAATKSQVSWHNFMENTIFHGVKYIFEGGKWIRRYLSFTLNILKCSFMIRLTIPECLDQNFRISK